MERGICGCIALAKSGANSPISRFGKRPRALAAQIEQIAQ